MLTPLCTACAGKSLDMGALNRIYAEAERRYGSARPTHCVECGVKIDLTPKRYTCADCHHEWDVGFTELESRGDIDEGRTEACPKCATLLGTGHVKCKKCGAGFAVVLPHWHVDCDTHSGACPGCSVRSSSLCVC